MANINKVKIITAAGTYDERGIGAEAVDVVVGRKSDGEIVTDPSTETAATTEELAVTLKTLETNTKLDTTLSTTSEKGVQNKVITAEVNKKQDVIQYTTMPLASSANVDKVYQYIGSTTSSYNEGSFYKCVNDGASYKWEEVVGGGGGHTIQNQAGTDLAQEPNMQFVDAHTSDDSTDNVTKVEVVKKVTPAQWDLLAVDGTADGLYEIDESGTGDIAAADVAYDNTTSGMTADDVQEAIDELGFSTVVLQKTLTTGSTSITFTDNAINSNSCFDWYSEGGTLMPSNWSVSNHTLTLTYPAQSADIVVGVQVLRGKVVV